MFSGSAVTFDYSFSMLGVRNLCFFWVEVLKKLQKIMVSGSAVTFDYSFSMLGLRN